MAAMIWTTNRFNAAFGTCKDRSNFAKILGRRVGTAAHIPKPTTQLFLEG